MANHLHRQAGVPFRVSPSCFSRILPRTCRHGLYVGHTHVVPLLRFNVLLYISNLGVPKRPVACAILQSFPCPPKSSILFSCAKLRLTVLRRRLLRLALLAIVFCPASCACRDCDFRARKKEKLQNCGVFLFDDKFFCAETPLCGASSFHHSRSRGTRHRRKPTGTTPCSV